MELLAVKEEGESGRQGHHGRQVVTARTDAHGTQAVQKVMKRAIWMKVTMDEYELPVAVADTVRELSEMTGATDNNIRSSYSKYKSGQRKTCQFRKVEVEE